jgi:hypothetical protein
MIDVTCPMCGEVYHADPVHAGKRIQCRRCGSLVPILAAGGTIAKQTPGTPEVGQPSPRVTQPRAAPPSRRRNFWIFGSALAVAVIAGGLVSLLWYSNADKDGRGEVVGAHGFSTSSHGCCHGNQLALQIARNENKLVQSCLQILRNLGSDHIRIGQISRIFQAFIFQQADKLVARLSWTIQPAPVNSLSMFSRARASGVIGIRRANYIGFLSVFSPVPAQDVRREHQPTVRPG